MWTLHFNKIDFKLDKIMQEVIDLKAAVAAMEVTEKALVAEVQDLKTANATLQGQVTDLTAKLAAMPPAVDPTVATDIAGITAQVVADTAAMQAELPPVASATSAA